MRQKRVEGVKKKRPVFVASAAAPAADKKAREFPEILSEGLIAIIIVEWARGKRTLCCHGLGKRTRKRETDNFLACGRD